MATLTGRTIASSYTELLKTTSASGVTGSLDTVQDGDATDSALQISTAGVKSTGTLEVTGTSLLSGNVGIGTTPSETLDVNGTANVTSLKIGGTAVTSSAAELNYSDGVTSNIQTQLDAKQATLTAGDISTTLLANNAVTSDKLGDLAVTTARLNNAAVTTNKIDDDAVTGAKIADNVALGGSPTTTTQSSGDNSTKVATTAYVDAQVATSDTLAEVLANGNTTGSTNIIVSASQSITTDTISETTSAAGVTIDSVLVKDNSVTATTFTGALTGNVTGDVTGDLTGDVTGNVSGTAATVTGATQAAITSAANLATVGTIGTGVWQGTAVDGAYVDIEGTEIKSTGESGGTKFLREDGDGTCSWQTVAGDIEGITAGNGLTGGGTSGTVTINAAGTSNRISVSADAIDIDSAYVGQTSITTLGTIATGTWNGTAIDGAYVDIEGTEIKSTGESGGSKFLREDGDGTCSWQTINADPAGSNSQIQFNNSGSFGADSNLVWDDTNDYLGIGTALPSSKLEISGSGTLAKFTGTGTTTYLKITDATSDNGNFIGATGDTLHFWTDNTKALTIDGSQRIGIGTAAPTQKLHVEGEAYFSTASGGELLIDNSGASGILLQQQNGGATNSGSLNISSGTAAIFTVNDAERMRINSSGQLGLGTASPSANLHVSGSNPKLRLQDSDETNVYTDIFNQSGDTFFRSRDGSSNGIFTFNGNNGTSDTEYLRIDSNGALGIGGANYGTSGQVLTSNGSGSAPSWQTPSGGGGGGGDVSKVGTPASGQVGYWTGDGTLAGEDAFSYDATNNRLMIGTNVASTYNLHVNSTGSAIVQLSGGTNYAQELRFGDASSYLQGRILYNTLSDFMSFDTTDGTERMRINSTGLGIGESPSDVTVTGLNQLVVGTPGTGMNSGNTGIVIGSSASESGALTFLDNVGSTISGRIEYDHSVDSLYFKVNTSTRMTIDSSGNLGLGTTAPSTALHLATISPVIKLEDTDATGTPQCEVSGAGGDLILRVDKDNEKSSSTFIIQIDGSEQVRINKDGAWSFDGGSSFGNSGMDYLFSDGNGDTPYWDDGFGLSDSRLKENVKEFKALDSINKLRPVEFDWNDKAKKEGHDFGLIAQEVEPVLPNIVRECRRTGYKKLDYEGMVPFLVQSVKELTEENKALRERLDAIEQKVQSL